MLILKGMEKDLAEWAISPMLDMKGVEEWEWVEQVSVKYEKNGNYVIDGPPEFWNDLLYRLDVQLRDMMDEQMEGIIPSFEDPVEDRKNRELVANNRKIVKSEFAAGQRVVRKIMKLYPDAKPE